MAYINFLDTIGTIGNKEVCLSIIKSRARDGRIRNLSDHQLAMEINGNHRKSEDRFFSKEYREYPEYESRVYYLWINTGIKHKEHNEDIYVQFARSKGDWQGGHVGTESEIIRGFLKTARPDQIREDLRMSTEGLFGIKGNILEDITFGVYDRESGVEIQKKKEEELKKKALENRTKKELEKKKDEKIEVQRTVVFKDTPKNNKISDTIKVSTHSDVIEEEIQNIFQEEKGNNDIINTIEKEIPSNKLSSTISLSKTNIFEGMKEDEVEFFKELYNKLLVQKGWELENGNLISYIKILVTRINNCIGTGREEYNKYLIFNKDKTCVLFNSAFLDNFGNNIMIVNHLFKPTKDEKPRLSYNKFSLAESKSALNSLGFSKSDIASYPTRIPFYNNDVSELIFTGDIDDIDTENYERLTHCIIERKERFPDFCKDWTNKMHYDDLVEAIEFGVKLSKYDSGYIKPIYNPKYDRIQYIIPYHIRNNFENNCELGIVITKEKDDEYWQVMTILDYEQCIKDIKILSLYTENSFV